METLDVRALRALAIRAQNGDQRAIEKVKKLKVAQKRATQQPSVEQRKLLAAE